MTADEQANFIQRVAVENAASAGAKILWSTHAVQKLSSEGLRRLEVETALGQCQVVEPYRHAHRGVPDCLALGFLGGREPFHAVIGIDRDYDRYPHHHDLSAF